MKSLAILYLAFFAVFFITSPAPALTGSLNDEFEGLCAMVNGADSLTIAELQTLIDKADKLSPQIESSDDPSKKTYLFRLKKCRSFFEFMLESKKSK